MVGTGETSLAGKAVPAALERYVNALPQRHRQDGQAVIVDVLSDQIDTARRPHVLLHFRSLPITIPL